VEEIHPDTVRSLITLGENDKESSQREPEPAESP
jgi:hypothetical protein